MFVDKSIFSWNTINLFKHNHFWTRMLWVSLSSNKWPAGINLSSSFIIWKLLRAKDLQPKNQHWMKFIFVQLVLRKAIRLFNLIESQTWWMNPWIYNFAYSWINSNVNSNHEIINPLKLFTLLTRFELSTPGSVLNLQRRDWGYIQVKSFASKVYV